MCFGLSFCTQNSNVISNIEKNTNFNFEEVFQISSSMAMMADDRENITGKSTYHEKGTNLITALCWCTVLS
jgi:hypothetical protein